MVCTELWELVGPDTVAGELDDAAEDGTSSDLEALELLDEGGVEVEVRAGAESVVGTAQLVSFAAVHDVETSNTGRLFEAVGMVSGPVLVLAVLIGCPGLVVDRRAELDRIVDILSPGKLLLTVTVVLLAGVLLAGVLLAELSRLLKLESVVRVIEVLPLLVVE